MRENKNLSGRQEEQAQPLPWYIRYYIYGVQGFTDEIIFTAVFDFFALGTGWTLRGHSAISTFFIYGTCSFMVERLYVFLYYKHGIRWYVRIPLYVCIAFSWEFTTGIILRQFDACPWDYSQYPYNFMGLITLEYAPGWAFLALVQDVMAEFLLHTRILPPSGPSGKHVFLLDKSDSSYRNKTTEGTTEAYQENGFIAADSNRKQYYLKKQKKHAKNHYD